uniref:Homeobox protein ESX1-like n=1 Tax=Nicotiana sylvestris TaxID=4096 RepID=A0A1U7V9M6_NICSY|nr:PREDICTED: homeobox protein ESX1-like [Nicotiana sylvestris]
MSDDVTFFETQSYFTGPVNHLNISEVLLVPSFGDSVSISHSSSSIAPPPTVPIIALPPIAPVSPPSPVPPPSPALPAIAPVPPPSPVPLTIAPVPPPSPV